MSQQIQIKQQYLRTQILNEGIDPGEFLMFLIANNSNKADNLELWSIQELQQIVKAFKNSKNAHPVVVEQVVASKIVSEQFAGKYSANYQEDHSYFEEIKCLNKQPNKISTFSDFKLKITNFEKYEGGLFERSYILYTIQIPILKTNVGRRYSDFVWLRDTLIILYPGYPIPPIKRKGNYKRYDDKYLIKKMLILEKFLNTLVSIPQIFSEPLFERFLTISDPKEFEKLKIQYNKLERTIPLAKVKTLSGYVSVGTQKKMTYKVCKYQEYLKVTQPEIKKIYKSFKGASTCFQQANEYFQSISNSCNILRGKQEVLRAELELPSISGNSPLSALQNLARQYGVQLQQQACSFRKEIYSLMKYQNLYRINMLEYMDQLAIKQQEYFQAKAVLIKKKDRLYTEGKIDRWGLEVKITAKPPFEQAIKIMLPKQTKEVMQLRESFALFNCQIYEQCSRHTKDINRILSDYIQEFIDTQLKNAAKTAQIFSQISRKSIQIKHFYLSPTKND